MHALQAPVAAGGEVMDPTETQEVLRGALAAATEAVESGTLPIEVVKQLLEIERENLIARDALPFHLAAFSVEIDGASMISPPPKARQHVQQLAIRGAIMGLPKGAWRAARIRFPSGSPETAVIETIDGRMGVAHASYDGNVTISPQDPTVAQITRLTLAHVFPGDPLWPPEQPSTAKVSSTRRLTSQRLSVVR